jgi:hypothetical protein
MASNTIPKVNCYDRLVSEIATLECVRAALSEVDSPDNKSGNISSAELVLTQMIARLYRLSDDVMSMQEMAAAGRAA